MKVLTDQLTELSDRAKSTSAVLQAAGEKNRGRLETQRATLLASVTAQGAHAGAAVVDTKNDLEAKWSDARTSVDERFTALRAEADERRAEHGVAKAQHHADLAEQDAAVAVALALHVLNQAEYAVIDAALARADADDLDNTP